MHDTTTAEPPVHQPTVEVQTAASGERTVQVSGEWDLDAIAGQLRRLRRHLKHVAAWTEARWDLSRIKTLDSIGALLLWRTWGEQWPRDVEAREQHRNLISQWSGSCATLPKPERARRTARLASAARRWVRVAWGNALEGARMLGQLVLDASYLAAHPARIPWREISAEIHAAGNRALKITAMVGFLIGVVVSYLSSIQLKMFGVQQYIVDLLGISIVRELGPMLAALLVAGRSGSSMTAQLGVMRVTQELDAIDALGISLSQRLIFPKVVALVVVMPLIILWTDVMALIGGMAAAYQALDVGPAQFMVRLPTVLPVSNLFIGMLKGVMFGALIALTACFYGLRIEPNTESLSRETTSAVVIAITQVILADAVFAILFQGVGLA